MSSAAVGQNSTISTASEWLASLVTGSLATGIAVITIAFVGFAMLNGRIDVRRGASAIAGCFLLFGAPAIAQTLSDLARSDETARPDLTFSVHTTPPPLPDTPPQDLYGGASLIG